MHQRNGGAMEEARKENSMKGKKTRNHKSESQKLQVGDRVLKK